MTSVRHTLQRLDKTGERIRLVTPKGDHIGRAHAQGGFYEEPLLEHLATLLDAGSLVLDVGAHVGNHAVFFAARHGHEVIAVEPNPDTYGLLVENVQPYPQIRTLRAAVGSSCFHRVVDPPVGNSGMSRCVPDPLRGRTVALPLDAFEGYAPDLVKIDVEGRAADVIRTGPQMLAPEASERPIVVVEGAEHEWARLLDWGYVHKRTFCATPTHVLIPKEHPRCT